MSTALIPLTWLRLVKQVTDNLQASFALAADVLITFGLCWRLNKNRGGIQSYVGGVSRNATLMNCRTNKILNFLIMTAINRGVFTMIFAALNMILVRSSAIKSGIRLIDHPQFITQPQKFYFMIAILLSDKCELIVQYTVDCAHTQIPSLHE